MNWIELLQAVIGDDDGSISFLQMSARAVIVFVIGIVLLRITISRIFSKTTPIDIVLSVIIGSNLSRTLTGNAPFVEVIGVTILLVALHAALNHAAARWRPLATLIKGNPKVLVKDGTVDWDQMKACALGERDLDAAIRASGATDCDEVKLATLERGGDIDVVLK